MRKTRVATLITSVALVLAMAAPAAAEPPDDAQGPPEELPARARAFTESAKMSPDRIWGWRTINPIFGNDCVEKALEHDYRGRFTVRQTPNDNIEITLSVSNFVPGSYRAIVNGGGGYPNIGPQVLPHVPFTITPEDEGHKKVTFTAHAADLVPREYTWGLGIDAVVLAPHELCTPPFPQYWSVLWTESDLTFTID